MTLQESTTYMYAGFCQCRTAVDELVHQQKSYHSVIHLHIKVYIYANAFMKRASAIKVVLSCTGSAGKKRKLDTETIAKVGTCTL
jgi:hypothetical protein